MIVAGIDIGSVATKALVLVGGEVAARAVTRTGADPARAAEDVLARALAQAGLAGAEVERKVTTGFGRRSTNLGARVVTEVTAAARGAWELSCSSATVRTVVDLGGQDSKVILLDESGAVADFLMNDKCAAGTGRFIEVMAGVLEVSLDEMGRLSLDAGDPVTINSTCTVFAESEVISLIAQGRKPTDIVAGIHASIASRLATMVRRLDGGGVFFCGGGAKNAGMKRALEDALQGKVHVPPHPQFVVALGAALIAAGQPAGRPPIRR